MVWNIRKLKLNKLGVLFALIHWGITFVTDSFVFNYRLLDFSNMVNSAKALLAWGAKIVFLCLLVFLWQLIFKVVSKLKEGNNPIKEYFKITLIYFGIMVIFFVLLYPGLWRVDEFGILKNATNVLPNFWQGYLTSVFYIFALMLFPNPAGVVFAQIIVISLIVGYVIFRTKYMIQNKSISYLLYIPFLLFPVIDSNFYPMRMSIYAFLELLFAFLLFEFKYTKKVIYRKHIWILVLLASVLVCWRTESIYYIVLAPLTFLILFSKEIKKQEENKQGIRRRKLRDLRVQFVLGTILLSMMLTGVQMLGNKLESSKEYELTSIVLPITPLVNKANENEDLELINSVGKVFDTQVLIDGYQEGKTGIVMYWAGNLTKDYNDLDFQEMKAAYYKLILKYPSVFMKERLDTFLGSTGLLSETENLFSSDEISNYVQFRETYGYKEPPFRKQLIKVLEFTNYETLHNVVYSFHLQAFFLIFVCLVLLFQRKWGYFFICGTICAKIPLIFLTAPSRLFMYYYSIYLIGVVLVGILLVFWFDKIRSRMKGLC